jgi:LmbE family N-acetylglucosaminyl deacetylase
MLRAFGSRLLPSGLFVLAAALGQAQQPSGIDRGAVAIGENIRGLGTTTRVLMIGAHPDDEDTQLIAWLAKGRHVETAYLSLTRGDGGQNLIGNELGTQLGMIRTEELLAARRIDGGRQYFARAFDFGFSKTLEETMQRWPHDSILKDMVAIVRAFRPHVIVDVWTGTPADGHGHHQYAGVLGREVFDAAADSVRFPPSSVGGLKPWATPKFYRGRRANGALQFNVGEFDPLTGQTYSEIATISRSQHRSQGQGALPQPGPRLDGVQLEVSRVSDAKAPESSLFAGIDTSWARFKAVPLSDSVRAALDSLVGAERAVRRATDLVDPATMVTQLATYVRLASRAASGVTCTTLTGGNTCDAATGDLSLALASTKQRAITALLAAAGIRIDATAPRELVALGDTMRVTATIYNQGKLVVPLEAVWFDVGLGVRTTVQVLPDSARRESLPYQGTRLSSAWWLRRPLVGDMFDQPLAEMVVGEDRLTDSGLNVRLQIDGVQVPARVGPIVYRRSDAVLGEVTRPIATVPAISVVLDRRVEYARADVLLDRTVRVSLRSGRTAAQDVSVSLALPTGLTADSAVKRITLAPLGESNVSFRLRGKLVAGRDSIVATATDERGTKYDVGFVPIEYEHIRPLRSYRRASMQIDAVNATFASTLRVGYIRGVGDNVMPMLAQLGIHVTELDPATLSQTRLSQFTTIVLGPRAYQANPGAMAAATPLLMKFVRDGGTVVAQYGQQEMAQPGALPYAITLTRTAERVTDENAQVTVLDPGSPVLAAPNKITQSDFADWVQERGLYMPSSFDKQYRALFSMHDPGEPPNNGAVLVAPVGKGVYVYTTLSFFRQLPAGNPGAARLFINLLSARQRAVAQGGQTSGARP